jgi:beta-galactosidase
MKNSLALLIFLFLNIGFHFQLFAQREKIKIDKDWRFHFGHAGNAEKDFNYSIANSFAKTGASKGTPIDPSFVDTTWKRLDLPHDWAVELPFVYKNNFDVMSHGYKPVGGLFPETSIGWYRKNIFIPASDSGRRIALEFDGVFRNAQFWINGFYIGRNESGYIGVHYDVTDFIRYDKENIITVRVDATQYEGWFYEGAGIYRHVWLHKYNNVHVAPDGIFAHTLLANNKATITIETTVANEHALPVNATLSAYLVQRSGERIAVAKDALVRVGAVGRAEIKQQIVVNQPKLWSIDDPYLYRLVVEVKDGSKIVDRKELKYGIRSVEVKANGVFLNGKYVKLLGVNCHQDHAGVGAALPDYLQYYRISLLKRLGVNAYRASHHPPTPELLDACDSLGMLVMDETRLLNTGPEYLGQLERLVKRDRSRTSVFMWSIGNEEGLVQTNSHGKRMTQTMGAKLAQLDPTRTYTYAADLANIYKGINEVIPVRSFNYRQFAVADYHRDHPNQPIIGTEMGSTVTTRGVWKKDTIRGYVPDQDITAPWWASTAEEWWKLAAENDFWLGGFVWTGLDYRGEPTPYEWPNINSHFGIMDMAGFPKNIYYYYQSWWTDKDVLHISPHWNLAEARAEWPSKIGKPVDIWVNSNADEIELFLNGKSLGKKVMPRNGHLKWNVNYEPGTVKAVAYKQGRIFSKEISTTGVPTEVVVTPYKTTLIADGEDVSVINITAIDSEGRTVPTADNMIRFKVEGDAKIIGVGNGDPSSHESDKCEDGMWQRSLFNGHAQVLVQAGTTAGMIKFEASANGLWKGGTEIIAVRPESVACINTDPTYSLKGVAALPRTTGNILGADISFLPELEAQGIRFSDQGVQKDAIQILKDHGFNYIRLRIFNDPARDSGYSPGKGFCNLENTLKMAKRVKDAGLQLLLDFHYSDYWADPGKQYKPAAWRGQSFTDLKKSLYNYTAEVMTALQKQGTVPDMVQVGNEINHGIVWPEGSISHPDSLAQLIMAGTAAVKAIAPETVMMLHVALGGQNHESVFFIDEMVKRGVHFDVIGQSYYPKWHGTLDDLRDNLHDLAKRYNRDVVVVEYSALKEDVNTIAFGVPNGRGKGTFIWEPLSTWDAFFERDGKSNQKLLIYDELNKKFIQPKQ